MTERAAHGELLVSGGYRFDDINSHHIIMGGHRVSGGEVSRQGDSGLAECLMALLADTSQATSTLAITS